MFQPQPTPFASFAYGIGSGLPDYNTYQHSSSVVPATSAAGSGGRGFELIGPAASGGSGVTAGPPAGHSSHSLVFTTPALTSGAGPGAFASFNTNPNTNTNHHNNHNHHQHHNHNSHHQHHQNHQHHSNHHHHNANSNHNGGNTHDRSHGASHNGQNIPLRGLKMEPNMDDLAAQEAAAREYQPQLQGPLVGDKTVSQAITEEYAKADPIYVQKTLALPQSYSHYRQIRGDGNCGWRAIGFSYFETLIKTGDRALVDQERLRLTQTHIVGHDEFVFEDMRDETDVLMKGISARMGNQQSALAFLLERFNDPDVANPILYYLRLLASSWLKGDPRAADYAGFIPENLGIPGYCQEYLELPGREIEHLGIIILVNALLKPVNFVLEIAYLDRTPGPTVNTYRIPDETNNQDVSALGPIIYLLFRPDHYDILYRDPPAAPLDIQVNRVTFNQRHDISSNTPSLSDFAAVDLTPLTMIPGFSGLSPGLSSLGVPDTPDLGPYSPAPQPQPAWIPPPYSEPAPVPLAEPQRAPPPPPPPVAPPTPRRQTPPLRFSEYCHPSFVEHDTWHESNFTTNSFKNSHFNVAHYNNPNFQPEEYKPDGSGGDENSDARSSGRKKSNA